MSLRRFIADAVREIAPRLHMDAGETAFFVRELELIEARTYDVLYPELQGRSVLPSFGGLSNADEYWTWRQFDKTGQATEGHMDTDDIPSVEIRGTETQSKVVDIFTGYDYTVQDIRAAMRAGRPLDAMKAEAARDFVERKLDKMIALGSDFASDNKVYGLLNQPTNVPALTPQSGVTNKYWAPGANAKKPVDVVADLNGAYTDMVTATNYIHVPNTLILDTKSKAYIETTPCSQADTNFAGSVMTIEQYIRQNCGWLKSIQIWNKCDTAGPSSKARSVLYQKNDANGVYCIPQEFEQLPPQLKNFKFWVPCHARSAGVNIRYPKAFRYLDGFQA